MFHAIQHHGYPITLGQRAGRIVLQLPVGGPLVERAGDLGQWRDLPERHLRRLQLAVPVDQDLAGPRGRCRDEFGQQPCDGHRKRHGHRLVELVVRGQLGMG